MGGCLRKILTLIGGIVVIVIALLIVVAVFQPSPGTDVQNGMGQNQNETRQNVVATWTPTPAPNAQEKSMAVPHEQPTPIPEPSPTPKPTLDPNRGIVFGEPVVFSQGGIPQVAVMARNTTNLVKSFTVKATFKQGEKIVTTAVGAVNDMLPGQERPVMLLTTSNIGAYDSVRVDVDTMIVEAETTQGAEVARRIKFGQVHVTQQSSLSMAEVEVTNEDDVPHSLTVIAWWIRDGRLSGVGVGAVNDITPGQTKTASLLITGVVSDEPAGIAVDTVVQ